MCLFVKSVNNLCILFLLITIYWLGDDFEILWAEVDLCLGLSTFSSKKFLGFEISFLNWRWHWQISWGFKHGIDRTNLYVPNVFLIKALYPIFFGWLIMSFSCTLLIWTNIPKMSLVHLLRVYIRGKYLINLICYEIWIKI